MKDVARTITKGEDGKDLPLNRALLGEGSEVIRPFFEKLDKLGTMLINRTRLADPATARRLNTLVRRIDSFEPSVTLIGQVKAGKTALANVLSGNPELLPSDVNPWTSVVTSLHMNARRFNPKTRAAFHLFNQKEWDQLVKGGGRLGELAGRAGADEDLEKLRRQIEEIHTKARKRLSTKFEALLGKTHKYGYVDRELLERYVCLGDAHEVEQDPKLQQGRFSDLTKAAEMWIDVPELGTPLLLRDTPGVNDTFLVREQITINALRQSKACVVVLSAHQALNSTDLALMRMISSYKNGQVVLFVNRIDELAKPSEQVPEILNSIRETLKRYRAVSDVKIIFGSALWAEMALRGDYSDLDADAQETLKNWSAHSGISRRKNDPHGFVWELAGIPALMRAVNGQIIEGAGQRHLDGIRIALENIANEFAAQCALDADSGAASKLAEINIPELKAELEALAKDERAYLDAEIAEHRKVLDESLEKVKDDYVERARAALVEHLKKNPGDESWTYNSAGLRLILRTTYDRFAGDVKASAETTFGAMARQLTEFYLDRVGLEIDEFRITPPPVPKVPAPMGLGQTIAIDLSGTWWSKWWKRRREMKNHAEGYADLIGAEIETITEDLTGQQLEEMVNDMRKVLDDFASEQSQTLIDLLRNASIGAAHATSRRADREQAFVGVLKDALDLLEDIEPAATEAAA